MFDQHVQLAQGGLVIASCDAHAGNATGAAEHVPCRRQAERIKLQRVR